jgi:hypothetical protein
MREARTMAFSFRTATLRSDQIDYDYFAESGEDPDLMEMALARRLKDVVPRLARHAERRGDFERALSRLKSADDLRDAEFQGWLHVWYSYGTPNRVCSCHVHGFPLLPV